MKKLVKELKSKTIKELEKEIQNLEKEIIKLTIDFKVNPPKDTNILKKTKKKLAILLTVLREKKEVESLKK